MVMVMGPAAAALVSKISWALRDGSVFSSSGTDDVFRLVFSARFKVHGAAFSGFAEASAHAMMTCVYTNSNVRVATERQTMMYMKWLRLLGELKPLNQTC